ncbi:MAG: hypothetical protein ABL973_16975 [Micropepsaceae bacterium]
MKKFSPIILGGLAAGILDIVYAFVVYGPLSLKMSPVDVLHSVAAGWIGREAANAGGDGTALLGLATHFMIATLFAATFVEAANRFPALTARPVQWGVIYGLGLYVLMNYVVVPLSAAHASQHFAADLNEVASRLQAAFSAPRPKDPLMLAGTVFTHTIFVGVPIALITRRFARG